MWSVLYSVQSLPASAIGELPLIQNNLFTIFPSCTFLTLENSSFVFPRALIGARVFEGLGGGVTFPGTSHSTFLRDNFLCIRLLSFERDCICLGSTSRKVQRITFSTQSICWGDHFHCIHTFRSTLSSIAFSGASLGTVLSMLSRSNIFLVLVIILAC